jgi:hypothetical protein
MAIGWPYWARSSGIDLGSSDVFNDSCCQHYYTFFSSSLRVQLNKLECLSLEGGVQG